MNPATLANLGMLENGSLKKEQEKKFDPSKVLQQNRFDIMNPPERMDYTFKIFGYDEFKGTDRLFDVGSDGMLGLVMGEAKSRKTSLVSAIVASGLSNGNTYLNCNLHLPDRNIVFVDTEQGEQYFYRTQKRIHYLSGNSRNYENYHAFMLRECSIEERIATIDHIIETIPDIGLLVIDGAIDLVHDMNSQTESQEIVQRYMKWTADSNALLLTVIHSAYGFSKAIGHLGSYLDRKCDFSIETIKDQSTGRTMVKQKRSRAMPFPKFEFTNNEDGYPVLDVHDKILEPVTSDQMENNETIIDNRPDQNDDLPF